MNKTLKILFYILITVANVVLLSYVLSSFWAWFVVPLGVKAIGMAQAYGLAAMTFIISQRRSVSLKPEFYKKRSYHEIVLTQIGFNLIGLFFGWIAAILM